MDSAGGVGSSLDETRSIGMSRNDGASSFGASWGFFLIEQVLWE